MQAIKGGIMKNSTKAKILGVVVSASLLSGCTAKQIDNSLDLKENDPIEIVISEEDRTPELTKIFEPFEHQITYQLTYFDSAATTKYNDNGWINLQAPTIKGYVVEDYEPIIKFSNSGSRTVGYMVFYRNVDTVEAVGYYDYNTNEVVFAEPGSIVEEKQELILK